MIMKVQQPILLLLALVGVGCSPTRQDEAQLTKTSTTELHRPDNGIYYWKTVFDLNETEQAFLTEHKVKRLYVRLFDIVPTNHVQPEDSQGFEAVPNATLTFRQAVPDGMEVVPVVYLTLEALRRIQGKEYDYASLIAERVMNMADFNDMGTIREIQLDCDWTQQTQDSYFMLCRHVKDRLQPYGIQLSCTIRLWQLSRQCPPVDYGVLMLYNTGNLTAESTDNAILGLDDVRAYLKGKPYDLPLSIAYPTFAWDVCFRNGNYMGLFHHLDLDDNTLYQSGQDRYHTVLKDHTAEQRELIAGDRIRHENVPFDVLRQLDSLVRHALPDTENASVILYHLDSANLSNYTHDEISQIYRHD